ncbi:MAG: Second mannosyl transferase [Candidatus Giovannonibacteria bacterium GW2011_GWB1_45_9b]|uniref:Second mannosyl transferase n=1 Tax=Candidatus Giovannonibacteria bacterium GW2011_GWB1_45_9b TaxID=1618653 RepID=A0A0G1R6X7_9BACT|nr:MAG: group 1 glycosyl transferase [Candidatus Peregrinibacteria bacterium GW2011_GWC2_39_14]KKU16640.1 MAG: Second mannosyl transferase [Candidatus Giovannonibacteria bacterium GW2011_GWB1_45_9b]
MKIVYFITKSHWGGAAKYVFDLASGLDKNKCDVFVASGGQGALKEKVESRGLKYLEIPHFERKINLIGDILSLFEVLALLWKIRPDIIHVNSSKAGVVCGVSGFLYKLSGQKLRMIFTAHGWAFHESRPKFHLFLIRLASKISSIFYDKIICVTTFDYNSALRYKIAPQRKLALIQNGINAEEIKFLKRREAQEKIFGGEKEFVIGTVGEWVRNKGWDILLKAIAPLFDKHPHITLALIAGGESPHREEISHEKIVIVEDLSGAHQYLKAFDVFVFPSRKEGLAYALLEASLAELPIIASAVGGNFDIIETDKTGVLVQPENHDMLARTLDKFIENPKQAKKFGKAAREKVKNNFSISRMRERTYSLYPL